MGWKNRWCVIAAGGLLVAAGVRAAPDRAPAPKPTHADAVQILARHAGYFDRYIAQDASLSECVSFMNRHGIYFGLLEVMGGQVFTEADCARVLGQIHLLLSGEAQRGAQGNRLPPGVDSWGEFCTLNAIDYTGIYRALQGMVQGANT